MIFAPLAAALLLIAADPDPARVAVPVPADGLPLGEAMPADAALLDADGNPARLGDLFTRPGGGPAALLVVALHATDCPLSRLSGPALAEAEAAFADRGVRFVFVEPTGLEPAADLAAAKAEFGFAGPVFRDAAGTLTAALGATTTTETFVLAPDRTLRFRGAVSDAHGIGGATGGAPRAYLADALAELLAGDPVTVPATSSPGCRLAPREPATPAANVPPYHGRVAQVVNDRCAACHRDGGVGPFSLTSAADLNRHAGMVDYVVSEGLMPPWGAAADPANPDRWANDPSLSADEQADLLAWVRGDRPLGDPADAAPAPTFPSAADGWAIGDPDLVVRLPEEVSVKATGVMDYQHHLVRLDLTEDKWVSGFQVRPTAPAAVHHVLVFVREGGGRGVRIDERSGFLAAYVPGNTAQTFPAGAAKKLPAGSSLIFQMHYTPTGKATTDRTELALTFCEPPEHELRSEGIADVRLNIPPGESDHAEGATGRLPAGAVLTALFPHMHLRGKAFAMDLVRADGTRETLLDVPKYDFNWQLAYRFAEPFAVPDGAALAVRGTFDNSPGNPFNPDPAARVKWGPQTTDEMLIGYVEYYLPTPETEAAERDRRVRAVFDRFDENGDGAVTPAEFPRPAAFARLDADGDGRVTFEEARPLLSRGG